MCYGPRSFSPAPIRRLRDYTRLRVDLTRERTRHWQRLEKPLEDSLIKVSSVASTMDTLSVRDMGEALIAGERDPRRLAELARGRMRSTRSALIEALTGRFDEHHAEIARMPLDQSDTLSVQIERLSVRAEQLLAAMPGAQAPEQGEHPGAQPPGTGGSSPAPGVASAADLAEDNHRGRGLSAWQRLDEITGIGPLSARVIIAEVGLDMGRFATTGHLVSWSTLSPRTIQSGTKQRGGATGKGNPYLKGVLGEAATAAAKTNTFLGERYRRIVKRRGTLKALVAVARSILVIVWHLLSDPTTRFHDLGADYHAHRVDTTRKIRNHVSQLTALGYRVTIEPAT